MTRLRNIGDFGEELTCNYLKDRGYIILTRNYNKPYGELDIIAREGNIICFVEVKTRKSTKFGYPREAVNYKKQARIQKASQMYLMENKLSDYIMRFDVAEVILENKEIIYIENAF